MPSETLRRITGAFKTPAGELVRNKSLSFFKTRRAAIPQGASVVLDEPVVFQTDADGVLDCELVAGNYTVLVRLADADRYFRLIVPDSAGPHTPASLMDAAPIDEGVLTLVQQAQAAAEAARDLAEQWAEEDEDSAVASGQFSAKHHALKAAASAAAAAAVSQAPVVATRAALKAIGTGTHTLALLNEPDREGLFEWDATVLVATHQADAQEITFVAPDPAANGAWVRHARLGLGSLVEPARVRDLRGLAVASGAVPVVSELTDPTLAGNRGRRVILAGQPPILAWCDGAKWWDLTGGAEITPWWLPRGAVLHCDFTEGRFYWDGAERVLGDLTAVAGGGYSLNWDLDFVDTIWLQIEWSKDALAFAGHLFSWTSGHPGGDRIELSDADVATYGDAIRWYLKPATPSAGYQWAATATRSDNTDAVWIHADQRKRSVVRMKSGEVFKSLADNGDLVDGTLSLGTLAVPSKIGFGCRAWAAGDPDLPASDATLHRVTIWTQDLSAPQIAAVSGSGVAAPVHLLGDSFLNLHSVLGRFQQRLQTEGKMLGISQDHAGASTLTQQAARYAAYAGTERERWWDATLVIVDGGLTETAEQAIEAMRTMLGYIRHDRWLYLQAAPSATLDPVVALPERDAIIKAWCGDHFVSTLAEAWAESDGSPTDEDQVALGRWPVSLTVSGADFHPNATLGAQFLAGRIYDALEARGWV